MCGLVGLITFLLTNNYSKEPQQYTKAGSLQAEAWALPPPHGTALCQNSRRTVGDSQGLWKNSGAVGMSLPVSPAVTLWAFGPFREDESLHSD